MKKLPVFAALGLAVSLSGAPAFADQQTTGDEVDNALNCAAAGGRGGIHGAHAEPVHHGGFSGAYDMVDPPAGSGGNGFLSMDLTTRLTRPRAVPRWTFNSSGESKSADLGRFESSAAKVPTKPRRDFCRIRSVREAKFARLHRWRQSQAGGIADAGLS